MGTCVDVPCTTIPSDPGYTLPVFCTWQFPALNSSQTAHTVRFTDGCKALPKEAPEAKRISLVESALCNVLVDDLSNLGEVHVKK